MTQSVCEICRYTAALAGKNIIRANSFFNGRIDVLVNNAGYLARENFTDVTSEEIDKSMAVNLKSAVKLSQASLSHLQRSKGNIVNVSSIAGLRAYPGALAYKMSKAAMDQMTRCVTLEVRTH